MVNDILDGLNQREKAFILEYLISYEGKASAIKAGYSPKTAVVKASQLLAKPKIKAVIAKMERAVQEEFKLERSEVLLRLWRLATRDARKYLNDQAILDPMYLKHELDDREAAAIDGIKQKVIRRYTEEDGTSVEILETEVRLSPVATSIEMAMKHLGLFEADNKTSTVMKFDFDELYRNQAHTIDKDPIEQILARERAKLTGPHD